MRLAQTQQSGPVSRPEAPLRDAGSSSGIYLGFVPWVLFGLVAQHDSLSAAAIVALLAATVISIASVFKGRPKLLELAAVTAFAAFTVVSFLADPTTSEWVARYARAMAAAGLALTAFGSLLFVPLTEQYARESVPRQYWTTPTFKKINRRLTMLWGWVFLAMIPAHLLAGAIDTHRANTIFNWMIPIVLVVWASKQTSAATEDTPGA